MILRLLLACLCAASLAACGPPIPTATTSQPASTSQRDAVPLFPNETPQLREQINRFADLYGVPRALVQRVVVRESTHRPGVRSGPYYGLMQLLPATARGIGFRGSNSDLLNAETNLRYGVKYLRGAWLLSNGSYDRAVMFYARGYYYEARDRCMLVATGLRDSEVSRRCR